MLLEKLNKCIFEKNEMKVLLTFFDILLRVLIIFYYYSDREKMQLVLFAF